MTLTPALAASCNAYFLTLVSGREDLARLRQLALEPPVGGSAADLIGLTSAWSMSPLALAEAYRRLVPTGEHCSAGRDASFGSAWDRLPHRAAPRGRDGQDRHGALRVHCTGSMHRFGRWMDGGHGPRVASDDAHPGSPPRHHRRGDRRDRRADRVRSGAPSCTLKMFGHGHSEDQNREADLCGMTKRETYHR